MSWRSRFPDEGTCVRCLETKDITDLDRIFWCQECREAARTRAKRWGWLAGGVAGASLALWIWLGVRPSDLIIGGWIATVVACLWLVSRISREVLYGGARYRNRRAVEATPPTDPPAEPPDADEAVGWQDGAG